MTFVTGPMACISCGLNVWWDRVGASWRLMEGHARHVCSGVMVAKATSTEWESKLCNAYMPNAGTVCARRQGHTPTGGHRSRTVMDDEAKRRRTVRLAA